MNTFSLKIDKDTKCRILKLFEKTPQDLEENVCFIKKWLRSQLHLPEIPTDSMIEYFLVNNKFCLENTKRKIDAYYTARILIHQELGNIHPKLDWVKDGFNSLYVFPLPKLKDGLYRTIFLKLKPALPESFKVESHMANLLNLYEVRMHEDLMLGDIVIIDFVNLKLGHIIKATPSHIKFAATILERVYSNRLKAIHVINYPPGFDILFKLTKLFVKPKLMNRLNLHDSLDSLVENIPLDILPEEYGGNEKSLDELQELLSKKFIEYGPRFDKIEHMKINESLRPKPLKENNQFGVDGSFRKLNLD